MELMHPYALGHFIFHATKIEAYRAILLISGIQKFGWNSF